MSITVELHIFSGRPDPRWEINDEQWKNIHPGKEAVLSPPGNGLGYRGFSLLRGDVLLCSVGTGGTLGSRQGRAFAQDMQQKLLETAPEGVLPSELGRYVKTCIESSAEPSVAAVPPHGDDARWNAPGVLEYNNCYNYACNIQNNTFAQPGRASGNPLPAPFTLPDVQAGAAGDGLQPILVYPVDTPEKKHYVALGYWPGNDYHWWRLDDDGAWSHKPGRSAVLHADNRGYAINAGNPPSSPPVLGPYTVFGGYYFVPEGITIF